MSPVYSRRSSLRFVCISLALIVMLSSVMLAIHVIGGLFPNPIAVLFTNPDGSPCQMPCLFGVRPGVTTLDEGLRILDKHPLTHKTELYVSSKDRFVLHSMDAWITL